MSAPRLPADGDVIRRPLSLARPAHPGLHQWHDAHRIFNPMTFLNRRGIRTRCADLRRENRWPVSAASDGTDDPTG